MRFFMKNKRNFFYLTLLALNFLICSCKPNMAPPKFEIGNDFYYWETTADSNLGDAMKNMRNFKKLEDLSEHNLMNIFGRIQKPAARSSNSASEIRGASLLQQRFHLAIRKFSAA